MNILESFKDYLKQNLTKCKSYHPYFEEALNYMLLAGGKHFRAQLLLGVVNAVDKSKFNDAMAVAMALEMIHSYSLIHDDLPSMDNADFRRGIPTIHKKYDEVTAILVGDALNSDAFLRIANANLSDEIKVKCVRILAHNAGSGGMVLGQALDCFFEKTTLELDKLEFLHLHKTGALIAASLELGAVIAGLSDEKAKELYKIGLKIGLAFQIQDDLIDATATSEEAGKPTNHDEFKNSFVNLIGIERSKAYKEKIIAEIGENLKDYDENLVNLISNLIEKYLKG